VNELNQYFRQFKRYRTPVLAVLSTVMLVFSAVWTFNIPWQEILEYFVICLLGVLFVALLSAALVYILKRFRTL
jgi:dolichyl-phosphate-mannose--protein O-mannosyl transferase